MEAWADFFTTQPGLNILNDGTPNNEAAEHECIRSETACKQEDAGCFEPLMLGTVKHAYKRKTMTA